MIKYTRTALFLATISAGPALLATGCGDSATNDSAMAGDLGTVGLDLSLPGGSVLNTVSYTVTAAPAFTRTGTVDVSNSNSVSTLISLPAGGPYTVTFTGTSTDGTTNCAGSATFSVAARATTPVSVHLTCHQAPRTGSALVTGSINVCPQIDGVSASAASVFVGKDILLTGAAHDTDVAPSALAFAWTSTSGTFSSASAPNPTFTCTSPGTAMVTLTVTDGDTAPGCADTQTIALNCEKATATLALFGDWPYGAVITTAPSFIAQVNADPDVDQLLHIGDIHSGSQPCGAAYNQQIFGLFQSFADPLVYRRQRMDRLPKGQGKQQRRTA